MFKKIFQWLSQPESDVQELGLEREIQTLRLDIAERDRELDRLRAELKRQHGDAQTLLERSAQTQREQLLRDVAAPVAQVLTQAYLAEVEGVEPTCRCRQLASNEHPYHSGQTSIKNRVKTMKLFKTDLNRQCQFLRLDVYQLTLKFHQTPLLV